MWKEKVPNMNNTKIEKENFYQKKKKKKRSFKLKYRSVLVYPPMSFKIISNYTI